MGRSRPLPLGMIRRLRVAVVDYDEELYLRFFDQE